MKILGLRSVIVKKFKPCSNKKVEDKIIRHDLLKQNFKSEKPGLKWLGDITYIYTKERGWTYLAIVLDLKVIGWEYGINMTDELAIKALKKAVFNRQPIKGIIFHSDRGSQYISKITMNYY